MGAFLAMFVFVWILLSFTMGSSTNITAEDAYVFWVSAVISSCNSAFII